MKKLYNWEYHGAIIDTLILSRLSFTNRPLHPNCPLTVWDAHAEKFKSVGSHTLMNLGFYAGCLKGDFGESKGWETYNEEMLEYCVQDVKVTCQVFRFLTRELQSFNPECIKLEMRIAKYLQQQQVNGWLFNFSHAMQLESELKETIARLELTVCETFLPLPKRLNHIQPRVLKHGALSSVGLKFLGVEGILSIPLPTYEERAGAPNVYSSGDFTRLSWPEFNLGSRQQIAEQLLQRGWKPKILTPVTLKGGGGNIVINEEVLEEVRDTFPEAALIADYFMVTKRLSMITNWINAYDEDTKRIHGYVNTLGAVTARMTHSNPNLAQVPASKFDKEGKPIFGFAGSYGADCRSLFTVLKNYKQVGCDAKGLELRCLAHYMNDKDYTNLILTGDIHTANQQAAGLPEGKPGRDSAKTFIYAFLYGAGDAKIGSIVGGGAKEGKKLKQRFLDNTPALKRLRENVSMAAERGWLKGIDGRKVMVRHSHAALNTLLQSAGAIAMKVWLDILILAATEAKLDFKAVGNIHDEGQFEVKEEDVEQFSTLALAAMVDAGTKLGFRCPLEGDVKVGNNWCETH